MESQYIGAQHGAHTRKTAGRIAITAGEQVWTGYDFLSTKVLTAGHYVFGFAQGLLKRSRSRPRRKRVSTARRR